MDKLRQRNFAFRHRLSCIYRLLPMGILTVASAWAQSPSGNQAQLIQQMEEMRSQLAVAQKQMTSYQTRLEDLEQKVVSLQKQLLEARADGTTTDAASKLAGAVEALQEEQEVQQAELQVHEQTKVETSSRFPLKVSGLVLFNVNGIDGVVNSTSLPAFTNPRTAGVSNGSLSATMNQTLLSLESSGPEIWGAHSYGNVQVDFFSEQYSAGNLTTAGRVRLRTADVRLLWPNTKVQAGISRLIITPTEPKSYLSVAEPTMSWSGNLWAWIPQLAVDHTFWPGGQKSFSLQGALLDVPDAPATYDSAYVSAAERSRYPGSALHSSFSWGGPQKSFVGLGGYWSPHSYGTGRHVNGQAITADWNFELPVHLGFSGQAYYGAALGGLNEGAYKDVVKHSYTDEYGNTKSYYHALRDQGGWSQLSWNPTNRVGFDFAFGQDIANAHQLRRSDYANSSSYLSLVRNQTWLGNVIFHPHSSIILSLEYRRLYSWQILGAKNQAQIVGFAAGYQF